MFIVSGTNIYFISHQQQQQLQQLQQQQLLQQQQQVVPATINQSRNSVKFASPVRYSATRNRTVLKLKYRLAQSEVCCDTELGLVTNLSQSYSLL